MKRTNISPLPWRATKYAQIIADDHFQVAALAGQREDKEAEANLAFIVKAVNNHEPLLTALKEVDTLLFNELGNDWQHGEYSQLAARIAQLIKDNQ